MRAFVAMPLPEALVGPLLAVQAAIPVGRPVPEENLHLTLAFLGDVGDEALDALHTDLDGRRLRRCTIALTGLVSFGGEAPALLAAAAAPDPALLALRETVVRAARAAGIVLPRTRFRPHVTLVRFGTGLGPGKRARLDAALAAGTGLSLPPEPALALELLESVLTPEGAVHTPLARYPLA